MMSSFPLKFSVDSYFQSLLFLLSLRIFYAAGVHFHNFLKDEIIININQIFSPNKQFLVKWNFGEFPVG